MVAVGLWGGAAGAVDEVKVGYVDAQQVLDRAKSGQVSKEQLEQYVKSRQQLIDVDEEEIRRLEGELKKQASVLSPEAQQEKQEVFQRKLGAYQRRASELSKEVQDKRTEVLKAFNAKLTQVVRRVAEREGYAIVLDKEQEGGVVLYAREQMSLTDAVVAELDRMTADESSNQSGSQSGGKPAKPAPSGAPEKRP
jgi:outer membrane protein